MDDVATALLREAAEWRLIGLLMEHPGRGWRREVRRLGSRVTDPALAGAVRAALDDAGEGRYLAALGPGGAASAREVAYADRADPGKVLADVTAFYRAFAYDPKPPEPPDHVAVETGFIAYLRLKEAYARSRGRASEAEIAAAAAEAFLADHLSALAQPLAERLAAAGNTALALAGQALLVRVGPPRRAVPTMRAHHWEDRSDTCGEICGEDAS
jgi:hypothetical protein